MALYSRLEVYQKMLSIRMIPVFYQADSKSAISIVEACERGGAEVIEFTHRADFAQDVFAELVKTQGKKRKTVLGVGSIIEAGTAAQYINLGANFVVSPAFNADVAKLCNRRKIPYLPGCGSVTEISQAEEFGVEICKVFPGSSVGGPEFIKSVLGPMPWSRLMPTGGVDSTIESISSWLKAGAACLGMGSKLIPSGALDAKALETIEAQVKKTLSIIAEVKH